MSIAFKILCHKENADPCSPLFSLPCLLEGGMFMACEKQFSNVTTETATLRHAMEKNSRRKKQGKKWDAWALSWESCGFRLTLH